MALLERRAFVYDLESLALLGTLDTPPNPRGLAALTSAAAPACLLALPAEGGAVRVYDCGRGAGVGALCELEAHKAPVVGSHRLGGGCLGKTPSPSFRGACLPCWQTVCPLCSRPLMPPAR